MSVSDNKFRLDDKYKSITQKELNSLLRIDFRVFFGNTLVLYIVTTKDGSDYVSSDLLDELLINLGCSIEDKSNIPRITLSTDVPDVINFANNPLSGRYKLSEASSNDLIKRLFPSNIFYYNKKHSLGVLSHVRRVLTDFCKLKYATSIAKDRELELNQKKADLLFSIKSADYIEVYDNQLNEPVLYVSVEGNKEPHAGTSRGYAISPFYTITIEDTCVLNFTPKVVQTVHLDCTHIILGSGNTNLSLFRIYENVTYNDELIKVRVLQDTSCFYSIIKSIANRYVGDIVSQPDYLSMIRDSIKNLNLSELATKKKVSEDKLKLREELILRSQENSYLLKFKGKPFHEVHKSCLVKEAEPIKPQNLKELPPLDAKKVNGFKGIFNAIKENS